MLRTEAIKDTQTDTYPGQRHGRLSGKFMGLLGCWGQGESQALCGGLLSAQARDPHSAP